MMQVAPNELTQRRLPIPALIVFAFLANVALAPAQEKLLRWHDGLASGVEAARGSGKPLFVVFRCVR
jgi:hypothetical protein